MTAPADSSSARSASTPGNPSAAPGGASPGGARPGIATALVVLVITCGGGYLTVTIAGPVIHDRYFPWIVGRALGLAAYLTMALLVALGTWLRHPWRWRWPLMRAETALRYHAALAAAAIFLVAGHLVFLASDTYAGVGWIGAVVPGRSAYRSVPVALGVAAFWACILVAGTARLGGRFVGRGWLPVHYLAGPIFAAVFLHGVLAGTDTNRLRAMYAVTGAVVVLLWVSRHAAARVQLAGGVAARAPLEVHDRGDSGVS